MNFFEHQEQARRSSYAMIALFAVAVVLVVAFLGAIGALAYSIIVSKSLFQVPSLLRETPAWVYVASSVVALGMIGLGTWGKVLLVGDGGAALALLIGGRRAIRTLHPAEARLLNVVEELAIAAGVDVPQVFVLDKERRINALAAGYAPSEAVLVVTRGALDRLTRAELQGMVAHEFAHILNGDMRLNMHLVGVIGGLEFTRIAARYAHLLGPLIFAIGSVGTLSGRAIRALLSRRREFLADAAAVQFTRDPTGIASALYKMRRYGAAVGERHSNELSHMYLGEPFRSGSRWLSTHPPVEERLRRIMGPNWDPVLRELADRPDDSLPASAPASAAGAPRELRTSAAAVLASIGQPTPAHLEFAHALVSQLPSQIRDALGTEAGAEAVLLALLLADPESRPARQEILSSQVGPGAATQAVRLAALLDPLGPRMRLPVLELAMPTLKAASPARQQQCLAAVLALASAGRKASLRDFVVLTLCKRHLGGKTGPLPVKHKSLVPVGNQVAVLISLLTHTSGAGERGFHRAMMQLALTGPRMVQDLSIGAVENALYELKLLTPVRKGQLVLACLGVVIADQRISVAEGELLRTVCAALDSPVPPLLETAGG